MKRVRRVLAAGRNGLFLGTVPAAACLTPPGAARKVGALEPAAALAPISIYIRRMGEKYKARILVIDDDPLFHSPLRAHLPRAGAAVQVAENALERGKAPLQPDLGQGDNPMGDR